MPCRSPRSRTDLKHYATTYEVVAELPGDSIRLGFTARPSRREFLRLAREHADVFLPHLSDDDTASYSAASGLRLGRAVLVRVSGRTERECADADARAA
jgi:hypothetical protein